MGNKLLKAAGLPSIVLMESPPTNPHHNDGGRDSTNNIDAEKNNNNNDNNTPLGISKSRMKWGLNQDGPPPSIDWDRWRSLMKKAEDGMMYDIATMNKQTGARHIRRFVARLMSRVRFQGD